MAEILYLTNHWCNGWSGMGSRLSKGRIHAALIRQVRPNLQLLNPTACATAATAAACRPLQTH
eukprot:722786-Pelagomonas_calceolata.AAC.1